MNNLEGDFEFKSVLFKTSNTTNERKYFEFLEEMNKELNSFFNKGWIFHDRIENTIQHNYKGSSHYCIEIYFSCFVILKKRKENNNQLKVKNN